MNKQKIMFLDIFLKSVSSSLEENPSMFQVRIVKPSMFQVRIVQRFVFEKSFIGQWPISHSLSTKLELTQDVFFVTASYL